MPCRSSSFLQAIRSPSSSRIRLSVCSTLSERGARLTFPPLFSTFSPHHTFTPAYRSLGGSMSLVRIVLAILVLCSGLTAQQKNDPKNLTIAEKTAGFEKLPGFIPLYWDAKAGKVWVEIDRWDMERSEE